MIDAHQHYWRIDRGDYGWLTPASGGLWRDYMPADLAPLIAAAGIARTIVVQAASTLAETRFLLDLAEATPSIAGVVGWADFEVADAPTTIASLAAHAKLVGLRPMVHNLPDPDWLARPDLDAAFAALIAHGLTFDALVRPRHLAPLRVRLERSPGLRVVIDHAAKPDIAAGGTLGWAAEMRALAADFPGLHVKLSGLATEAGDDWSAATLRPYADALLDAFGPERTMWGSDWPVVTRCCSYADWRLISLELLAGLNARDRTAILGGTAARFYRLPA